MMTARLPLLTVALFAVVTLAFAQRPSPRDLEELSSADALALAPDWLLHGNPQQRAWAAYWIGRDRQEQDIPDLLGALESYQSSAQAESSDWTDNDSALLVVLDTLIQLNADVSPNSAAAVYAKFPVPALVLLARSRDDARGALLRIFDGTKSWAEMNWLTVADLLAANPPTGFAARLLKELSIQATIQVLSPGQRGVGAGIGGDCAGSLGDGPLRGWPPVGAYRLAAHPGPGSELLAAGENPVYLVRTLSRDYFLAAHTSDCDDRLNVTLSDLSRDLIGQLLGIKKDQFALRLDPSLEITWSTAKAYLDSATAFVLKQEEILHDIEARLEGLGLLTEAEAASLHVPFGIEIRDVRMDKTLLPNLVFADPSISVTHQQE
jgi:hypothetical protein